MQKYKEGEYIALVWEDAIPGDLFVKGHEEYLKHKNNQKEGSDGQ